MVMIRLKAFAGVAAGAFLCAAGLRGQDMIAYKPDVLGVDRLFVIALNVPPATPEITVEVPPQVALLDRTPLPADGAVRCYYFRTVQAGSNVTVAFAGPIPRQEVSVEIWSFEDLRAYRELKNVTLPRRWPLGEVLPELKESQTVTTEKYKEYRRGRGGAKDYLEMSDDAIWALQPDMTIPRWHWTNVKEGCPVHGTEIYRGRAFYPWQNEKGNDLRSYTAGVPYPWKIKCPVGGELYPSNDFAADDFTSGEFPDAGIWGGCLKDGKRYGFIAEICQSYCHQMLRVAPACADSYLATGDVRYVHKTLVALSRLAVEYAYLATMTQHRHRNSRSQVDRLGPAPFSEGPCLERAGFTVYCIDQPGYQWSIAEAYDKIWPAIDQDADIIPYLQGKGFDVATHEDVRRFIEENLMAVWMQGAMDGATASNEPFAQRGMIRMAEMLNYSRGDEFMDWLYDGPGNMRTFVTNSFFRDGAPYESTGGYNGMHVTAIGPIVESVEHLREMRPELYPDEKYPDLSKSRRYHNVFDFSMNTVTLDRTYPRVGDDGSIPVYEVRGRRTWQNGGVAAFEHAYRIFNDPKFAWALANAGGWSPSLEFPHDRETVETAAAEWPSDWNDASRLSDGYGLAMLRSGVGDQKRSLWMMYGRARGHVHDDIMHIGLDAFRSEILGHLGYPRNWNHWTKNWITQILARQIPFVNMTATAQTFADAGAAHVAEAYAEAFTDRVGAGLGYEVDSANWQRRMIALIDVDDQHFYCLDLYRIFGGREVWWTFHCQEDFGVSGVDLVEQGEGTLAGPDVPYGDEDWLKANGCSRSNYGFSGNMFGFPHLYNVKKGYPASGWSADWALKNADGLHFRLHVPEPDGLEVAVCDGTSPAGGKPYEMKWVLMHRDAQEPAQAQIGTLMELYRGDPVIRSVKPLELSGDDEAGFNAFACVVELADRTDTIFVSAEPDVVRTAPGGFEFAGRFGLYSERDGQPVNISLIGGTRLLKNGVGVRQEQAQTTATISAVDYDSQTVVLDVPPDVCEPLVGRVVHVTNDDRRVSLNVLGVTERDGRAALKLEFDPCIGIGRVTGIEPGKVLTDTRFYLRGFRYYHGARIGNEEGTVSYRIAGIDDRDYVLLDAAENPDIGVDDLTRAFPADSWFGIYDYGVGDTVVWPNCASVVRK
jgi:hypothetical protein